MFRIYTGVGEVIHKWDE